MKYKNRFFCFLYFTNIKFRSLYHIIYILNVWKVLPLLSFNHNYYLIYKLITFYYFFVYIHFLLFTMPIPLSLYLLLHIKSITVIIYSLSLVSSRSSLLNDWRYFYSTYLIASRTIRHHKLTQDITCRTG